MAKRGRQIPEPRELSGFNRFELRLYRWLGVLPFRRFLFQVERLRHWRDGGSNKNYHMGRLSVHEAGRFEGYLLYNTFLHVVGLLLLGLFFVVKHSFYPGWHWAESLLIVLCLLNVWCIMLQRYNFLRIRRLRLHHGRVLSERVTRNARRLLERMPEEYRAEQLREDLRLVKGMLESLSAGTVLFLESGDAAGLRRMSLLSKETVEEKGIAPQPDKADGGRSIGVLAETCGAKAAPYSRIEKRVSGLQRLFVRGRVNILSPRCIVTEDGPTEEALDGLFPRKTMDAMEEKLCTLKAVMENALSDENEDGRGDHAGKNLD